MRYIFGALAAFIVMAKLGQLERRNAKLLDELAFTEFIAHDSVNRLQEELLSRPLAEVVPLLVRPSYMEH